MVKIVDIVKDSWAYDNNISVGDKLISVNGNSINDRLDFAYYQVVYPLNFEIETGNGVSNFILEDEGVNIGIEVEELKIRHCGNNCVFCFVTQNPKGMRKTIYVKDEDYRYSFLYGSYFTLTNTKESELERIIKFKLSPLYISVHAVNPEVRSKLLGIKKRDDLLGKMRLLADNGIQMHTQVVLVPDMNDGEVLRETITTMFDFFPAVQSVAVVPVGKTKHRDNLPNLKSVDPEAAQNVISLCEELGEKYLDEVGTRFVFPADEFYLKIGNTVPDNDFYESYDQYEDGVGMVRYYLERFKEFLEVCPKKIKTKKNVTFVTGKSFYKVLDKYVLPKLNKDTNLTVTAVMCENKLLGEEITVAGLLCGQDIIDALTEANIKSDLIVLPDNCINTDGILLDDFTPDDIANKMGVETVVFEDFHTLFDKIKS